MEFDNNKPIYIQIADGICEQMLSGHFKPGERMPSVREWGSTIGVNPNTVARSYELLADKGVILNQRGIGFFMCSDAVDIIMDIEKKRFVEEELPQFIKRAELLGINLKELI